MARAGMAAVIERVRGLIHDPAGASQHFTDDQIEQVCDQVRRDVYRLPLTPAHEVAADGSVLHREWFADGGWWESDAALQDGTHATIDGASTPAVSSADYKVGKWVLDATLTTGLYLTGRQHDVYAAAADLLEEWLADAKFEFDFLSAGRTFKRSQKFALAGDLIDRYRRRSWVRTSEQVRTDMNPWAPALY